MQVAKDSPLQISSSGTYLGRKFQIKELLHKLTSALVWNEWQIEFEDGEKAWIKEAQGTWAIFYFRSLADLNLPDLKFAELKLSDQLSFQENIVWLQKIYQVKFQDGSGTRNSSIFEFANSAHILNIEKFENEILSSLGTSIEFKNLNAVNLRSLDVAHRIDKISCPSCHVSMLVRFKSFSQRSVCRACHSIIDMNGDEFIALEKFDAQFKFDPLVKIGSSVKILGDEFEVLGCLRLRKNQRSQQTQYLMFSAFKSFRWLIEENGHWTISRPLKDLTLRSEQLLRYRGLKYRSPQKSELKLEYAVGEFFWQLKREQIFEREEFFAPPFMIQIEKIDSFESVYLGRYLSQRQLRSAVQFVEALPKTVGTVPHEASVFQQYLKEFFVLNIIFIIVCFFIQLKNNQVVERSVHDSRIVVSADSTESLASTEPFEIRGGPSAMGLSISSMLNESVQVHVHEIRSKTKYSVSAFTNRPEILLSHIPSGIYFLSLEPKRNLSAPASYAVHVSYGKKSWSNFYLALFILSLPTLLISSVNAFFNFKKSQRGGGLNAKFSR